MNCNELPQAMKNGEDPRRFFAWRRILSPLQEGFRAWLEGLSVFEPLTIVSIECF